MVGYNLAVGQPTKDENGLSTQPEQEMSWAKAIVLGVVISTLLIIFLGFLPSTFRYEWGNRSDQIAEFVEKTFGYEFKERYTLVRIHDAISMGFQTVLFVIPLVATYVLGERRRRRLGLRAGGDVKGYLPGK